MNDKKGSWQASGLIVTLIIAVCLCAVGWLSPIRGDEREQKLEELMTGHLAALGGVEKRAAAINRVVSFKVTVVNRVGTAGNGSSITGNAMLVSSGSRLRFGMQFPSPDYPGEDMAFDGKKSSTGLLPGGRRSQMSQFLEQQNLPLREGLAGGTLSTAWPLLRRDQLQPRLEYRGLKNIEGRQLHEVEYRPRKGATDLNVKLWFEPETYRHVLTQYRFQVGARGGTIGNEISRQDESHYLLSESFADFREVDGVMLPHKYVIQVSAQTSTGTLVADWTLTVGSIRHQQQLSDDLFRIQ